MRCPLPDPLFFPAMATAICAVAIGFYDYCLYAVGGPAATISWHLLRLGEQEPIVPLLFGLVAGILFGHLFWPNRG